MNENEGQEGQDAEKKGLIIRLFLESL